MHELIETQNERDCDKACARGAKCGAGEAIANTGLRPNGIVERHSHAFSEHDAGDQKDSEEQR